MPGAFWNSWQLWEKLCFVLAAGIVLVITLGIGKLTYNTWRLRKYAKIKEDTLALKRAVQHTASVRRGRAKEIPFGVRALEKGVEIEGVWNSGANTPAPSLPGSPTLAASAVKPKSNNETNEQRLHSPLSGMSQMTRVEIQQPGDRSISALATDVTHRSRHLYKPRRSSGLRFSNSEDAERGDVLERLEVPQHSSSGPSPTSSTSPEDSPTENTLLHPDRLPPSNASYVSQESNPFLDPITTPKVSVEESMPMSHLNSLVAVDARNGPASDHDQVTYGAETAHGDGHALPIRPFDANRTERQSQVVRKINSGFEILRPGTFTQQKQSLDLGSRRTDVKTEGDNKRESRKLKKKGKGASLV